MRTISLDAEAMKFFDFMVELLNNVQKYSVILLVAVCLILYLLEKNHKVSRKILSWSIRFGIGVLLSQSGLIQIAVSLAASRNPQLIEPFAPLIGYLILLWIKPQI